MAGKTQTKGKGFGPGSGDDNGAPGVGHDAKAALDVVKKVEKVQGKVNVVYGPHDLDMELTGLSITEVQMALKDVLSVESDAEAYVDGKLIENKNDFKLKANMRLEFMKEAGVKGYGE